MSINFGKLLTNGLRPDLYSVPGLMELCDPIAEKFDGEVDSALMMALNDAVASTVRSAALFCTKVEPGLLRPNTIRENF